MKKLHRAAILAVLPAFLFLAAGCSAARKTEKAAAPPAGPGHHATAEAHLNNGNHEAAIDSFTLAAEAHEDEKGDDHPDTIKAYIGLARAHHLKGDHEKGAGFLSKAGGLLKSCISSLNPAAGTVLKEMCDLLKSRGKHRDAAEIYKESVAIMEKNSLGKHPAMADTLMHMAETYREQGLHGEAVEIFGKARSLVEKDYGRSHPQFARIMMGLAASHSANGDHKAGKEAIAQAIDATEIPVKERMSDLAVQYGAMADVGEKEADYGRAAAFYRKQLSALTVLHGDNASPLIAPTLQLAGTFEKLGLAKQAETYLKRAVQIAEDAFGANSLNLIRPLERLAAFHRGSGNHAEADKIQARVKAVQAAPEQAEPEPAPLEKPIED